MAAVTAALLLPASTAWAAGDVVVSGGSDVTLSIPQLLADTTDAAIGDRTVTVRRAAGETVETLRAITIERLLDRADVDAFSSNGVTIEGAGRSVTLSRDQLIHPDAYPGSERPVFYVDAQGAVCFLRPSAAPGDLNGDEQICVPDGSISIKVIGASGALTVEGRASKTRIRAGQRVTFTAEVGGDPSGSARVRWTFDDGGRGSGTTVTHRFKRRGTYNVVVGATLSDTDTGGSDYVTIQVGAPVQGGPNRTGGGTNTDAAAPDSGAATGTTGPAITPPAAVEPVTPPATPRPKPVKPKPPAQPTTPAEPVLPKDQQRAVQEAVPAGGAEHVEGVLLSDASSAPTPATADAVQAARTGNLDQNDEATTGLASVPPAAVGSFAVLALLGLGAWWERRGMPRRSDG